MASWPVDYLVYIPTVICLPLAILGNINLFKLRNQMFMKKRARSTTFGINISLIMAMIAICAIRISLLHLNHTIFSICVTFLFISWWSLLLFLNTRNWIIYFKYKWTYYELQLEWQQIINPDITQIEKAKNWFISNPKYGKVRFVYKVFGVLHFIGCCLSTIGTLMRILYTHDITYTIIGSIFIIISLVPAIMFYAFIVCKTPSFNDYFLIHWESAIQSKISILLVIVFIISNVVLYATHNNLRIVSSIGVILLTMVFFAMLCVSTFMLIKYKQKQQYHIDSPSSMSSAQVQLKQILSNKKAMHLFMLHLSKEYSIECLLSYIEFTQYQQYVENGMMEIALRDGDGSSVDPPTKTKSKTHRPFASNIPMSCIVSSSHLSVNADGIEEEDDDHEDENKPKRAEDELLHAAKVCDCVFHIELSIDHNLNQSELEINISGRSRQILFNRLADKEALLRYDNVKLMDLVTIFDSERKDMLLYLGFSLKRYRTQAGFKEVVALFTSA
eukprot:21862_1